MALYPDTSPIIGPAIKAGIDIRAGRANATLREIAARSAPKDVEQQQEMNALNIESAQHQKTRRPELERRQDEEYQYQKQQRALEAGLGSLPSVQTAADYQEWREWMINEVGADEHEVPNLRPDLSDKEFKEIKRELIMGAGKTAAQMGLEEYKYSQQMKLEGQRFSKQLEIEDVRLKQALARIKSEGGEVMKPADRYKVYQDEHANFMAESGLINYDSDGKPTGYKRPLTKQEKAIIADRAKDKILFAEEGAGGGSLLDELAGEAGVELK